MHFHDKGMEIGLRPACYSMTGQLTSSFYFTSIGKVEEFIMVSTVLWDCEALVRDWRFWKIQN